MSKTGLLLVLCSISVFCSTHMDRSTPTWRAPRAAPRGGASRLARRVKRITWLQDRHGGTTDSANSLRKYTFAMVGTGSGIGDWSAESPERPCVRLIRSDILGVFRV